MRSPGRFDEFAELDLDVERVVFVYEQHPITQLALMRYLATEYREDSFEARIRVLQRIIDSELEDEAAVWQELESSVFRRDLQKVSWTLPVLQHSQSADATPAPAATRGIPAPKAARTRRLAAAATTT